VRRKPVTRDAHAFWLRSPGQAEIRSVTLPDPGPEEVLVRTLHSGISRGTETLVF
jgi:NADPH:quinone reductase-like Zn-dependent oxidoreductase